MVKRILLLSATLFLTTASFAGNTLLPGDKAPAMTVSEWVKGSAATTGKLRVVEFWATWCGPCKVSIPHLTELAHQYKGKVDFYGISVYERGKDVPKDVKDFVASMADKMDYNVALDSSKAEMAKNWMEAAEQHGIPTAFIVNSDNDVLWIGHPMRLDLPLAQALSGVLDTKAERAKMEKVAIQARKQREFSAALSEARKKYESGNHAGAEADFAALAKAGDQERQMVNSSLAMLYIRNKDAKRTDFFQKLIAGSTADQSLAGSMAFRQFSAKDGDQEFGRQLAIEVCRQSNDMFALNYAAQALAKANEPKMAVEAYDKALKAFETDPRSPRATPLKGMLQKGRDTEFAKIKN